MLRNGSIELPYWGRVIDYSVASNMKRDVLLPLAVHRVKAGGDDGVDIKERVLTLYLDGTQCMNPRRSDFAVAWAVPAMKAPKERRLCM